MYRKPNREQMTVEDFVGPFGGKLDENNRWVQMAEIIPWEMVDDAYAPSFKDDNNEGRPPITSRMAFGALYIKENENFPQARTLQHISENPYMQYFLGLTEFNPKPPFDSSMLTYFAKRFSKEDMERINEEIYRRTHPPGKPPEDGTGSCADGGGEAGSADGGENKGTMIVDATAAPADIRYPTDLSLLDECREDQEKIIDDIWDKTSRTGHKTSYNRKKARKEYLSIAKQRKPRKSKIRKAIREQLDYVERNIETIDRLLPEMDIMDWLKHHDLIETIRKIAWQQRFHYDNPKEPVPDRIVSVRQPHVRPIVRGKARSEVEFGQKLNLSIIGGYAFIDNQSWDNFSEGTTLIASIEKYRKRHGVYPKAVLADTIYRNRENREFCKKHGIRLSGPRLGRPKASEIEANRELAYQDSCDRNVVEGKIGVNKRRYGLNLIYSRLKQTGEVEAAMNIICMNVAHMLRVLLRLFETRMILVFFGSFRARRATI